MCDLPIWIQDFIGEISRDHTHLYFSSWTITIGCSHARRYQTRKSSSWIKTEKTPKIKNPFFISAIQFICQIWLVPIIFWYSYKIWFLFFLPKNPIFWRGIDMNHGMTGRLSYQSETVLMFGGLGLPISHLWFISKSHCFKITLWSLNIIVEYSLSPKIPAK